MDNKDKIILHLCADIGSDSEPYREAGYDVRLIGSDIGVENYSPPENVYGIIANPVCTMFSIARTNAKTPRDMKQGIWEAQYYKVAKHVPHKLKFWCIENPGTGYLKHYLGYPRYTYHPYMYGEDYTKLTALWGYFNIPQETNPFGYAPVGKSVCDIISTVTHPNKKERMHARSMCCRPFANAFFQENK